MIMITIMINGTDNGCNCDDTDVDDNHIYKRILFLK